MGGLRLRARARLRGLSRRGGGLGRGLAEDLDSARPRKLGAQTLRVAHGNGRERRVQKQAGRDALGFPGREDNGRGRVSREAVGLLAQAQEGVVDGPVRRRIGPGRLSAGSHCTPAKARRSTPG